MTFHSSWNVVEKQLILSWYWCPKDWFFFRETHKAVLFLCTDKT